MKLLVYLEILLSLVFISCSKEITIDNLIVLPADFESRYKIQNEQDLSYNDINRIQIRITVPHGLNENELENNLKHVTKFVYNKYKPDGISIFVYENGDDVMSGYTVAKSDFAPFGEWDKISSNNSLQNYKLKIDIRESYFKPKVTTLEKGSSVKLFREKKWDIKKKDFVPATNVALSKSINSWAEEDIIAYAINNSSAKIVDVHVEKLTDGSDFIRYKVLVSIEGKDYEGWVHGEEVK